MERKTLLTLGAIAVLLILGGVYLLQVAKELTQESTERETERITREEVERITNSVAGALAEEESSPRQAEGCALTPRPREFASQPYYTGPLFDAHIHMPVASKLVSTVAIQAGFEDMPAFGESLTLEFLGCLFASEGIRHVFGFYLMPNLVLGQAVRSVREMEAAFPGMIIPFFMPPPLHTLNPSPAEAKAIMTEHSGLFQGYGEIAFEKGTFTGVSPEEPEFLEMYAFAGEQGLIVMMHPKEEQRDAVDRLLTRYSQVRFLLHGGDRGGWILDVMEAHPNVYYSLDADMTYLYGSGPQHQFRAQTKEEYLAYFRQNFEGLLEEAVERWKGGVDAHPDRFLWGTDRWYGWHFDSEVGGLLEEFGRSFIGQLAPEVREKVAYQNAENLLER